MSDIWYFAEGEETRGPLRREELIGILRQASDPLSVQVWQSGFDDWRTVSRVSELAELVQPAPRRSVGQPPPIQVRQPHLAIANEAELTPVKPKMVRWLWGLGGLLIGIAYVLADLLLEWRGSKYLPWDTLGTISNVAQIVTSISITFLIAFAIGYAKDRLALRKK